MEGAPRAAALLAGCLPAAALLAAGMLACVDRSFIHLFINLLIHFVVRKVVQLLVLCYKLLDRIHEYLILEITFTLRITHPEARQF